MTQQRLLILLVVIVIGLAFGCDSGFRVGLADASFQCIGKI